MHKRRSIGACQIEAYTHYEWAECARHGESAKDQTINLCKRAKANNTEASHDTFKCSLRNQDRNADAVVTQFFELGR